MQGWTFALWSRFTRKWFPPPCEHKHLKYDELLNEHDQHKLAFCNDCGKVLHL